ncbi:hypothetical protein C5167_040062 [Papaver somniferum]|uniref:Uncharacterized protein n=1 Tax=Papaver somniferum TaxID=3469 RepID=A0A4Y7IHD2_PAPSO|nr:hypothetical protein C5167_040062 [Papaver somniferum]
MNSGNEFISTLTQIYPTTRIDVHLRWYNSHKTSLSSAWRGVRCSSGGDGIQIQDNPCCDSYRCELEGMMLYK